MVKLTKVNIDSVFRYRRRPLKMHSNVASSGSEFENLQQDEQESAFAGKTHQTKPCV